MTTTQELFSAWVRDLPGPRVAAVVGPPGAGATTTVREALREHREAVEPVWLAVGKVAGIDVPSVASTALSVTGVRKILVVDEADALASADPMVWLQIVALVRAKKRTLPVVFIAHGLRNKVGDALPRGAATFELLPRSSGLATASANKGLRGASLAMSGQGRGVEYRGDGIATGAIFDNYLTVGAPSRVVPIAEAFSAADAIDEGMCRAGAYENVYAALPISTAAAWCRGDASDAVEMTFGTVWSKNNTAHSKAAAVRAVQLERARQGRVAILGAHSGLDHLRLMMQSRVADGRDLEGVAAIARGAGLDSSATLAVMRLWKSGYSLTMHGTVKKRLLD
jgi:hypothetical protein